MQQAVVVITPVKGENHAGFERVRGQFDVQHSERCDGIAGGDGVNMQLGHGELCNTFLTRCCSMSSLMGKSVAV